MMPVAAGMKTLLERLGLLAPASRTMARVRGARARLRAVEGARLDALAYLLDGRLAVLERTAGFLGVHDLQARLLRAAGEAALAHGRPEDAERAMRKAIELQPREPAALAALSLLLSLTDRAGEALPLATEAVRIDPGFEPGHEARAYALARRGEGKEAALALRRASPDGALSGRGHILMLHVGRCGSTVLGDLLDQHDEIHWDREMYTARRRLWHPWSDPLSLLRRRMEGAGTPRFGFEFKPAQSGDVRIGLGSLLDLLDGIGFTNLVFLTRRNVLRRIVSHDVSMATDEWHARTAGGSRVRRIEIDLEGRRGPPLLERLEKLGRETAEAERLLASRRHLGLCYEEDVAPDPRIGYRRICEFVGISPRAVEIHYFRTNPYSLEEMVINYREMEEKLAGSCFEWMLREGD